MSFHLGFKALAYPASNVLETLPPLSCSLAFRCDAAANKATLLLVHTIPTAHGIQTFVIQYDADKLVSGAGGLNSGNKYVAQSQLDQILRDKDNKRSDIKTLALSVEQPCPLWCPDLPSFAYKPDCEAPFQNFVHLTKAVKIYIVFDYKYMRKEHQGIFKAFSKAGEGLTGFPVEALLTGFGLRKASWDVFSPVDAAGAPPAYHGFCKRPRQTSPNSPSRSPKRFALQSPAGSCATEATIPLSPDAAQALQSALKLSPAFDYQTEAIGAAVSKHLPAYLDKTLPTLLPQALHTLLATAPPTSNPSSPSKSRTSRTSHTSSTSRSPEPPPLTPLAYSLLPHLTKHLVGQFQQYQAHQLENFNKLLGRLWDSAEGARAHEMAEMMDEIEEHKTDMMLLKEDAMKDLSAEIDAVFEKGREEGWELSDALSEMLEHTYSDMCDRIETVKRVRLKKLVAVEVSKYKLRRRGILRGAGKSPARGHQKLLGRKREAEEHEWVDC